MKKLESPTKEPHAYKTVKEVQIWNFQMSLIMNSVYEELQRALKHRVGPVKGALIKYYFN